MAAQNIVSRLFSNDESEYTVRDGNVMYLNSEPLKRSFSMPLSHKLIALFFAAAALIISWVIVDNTLFAAQRAAVASQQAIENNLKRPGSLESLPNMATLINYDDGEIDWYFSEAGYTVLDYGALLQADGFMRWKIPSDMTAEEASPLLAQGIGSLNAEQGSKIMCGSWYYANNRDTTTTMVVRYFDFSTGDAAVAVHNAMLQQGFNPESITENGVDDSGNTFCAGTLNSDGTDCTWRISALPLDDIYSISGLPEDAVYVGIRVTEIA